MSCQQRRQGLFGGYPEGWPGMSDVTPVSGTPGLSFDSTLLSLVLLPSPIALSVFSFFSLYWPILLTFFTPQKILQYSSYGFLQAGGYSWWVVCAACCHMVVVLPLCFYIKFIGEKKFPFFYLKKKNQLSIN